MNKIYLLLFLGLSLFSFSLSAQLGGRYTYQFLNLVSSPKQAALGGKQITNYGQNPVEALYNPASINLKMNNQLAVSYVNYIGDINYGAAAYAFDIGEKNRMIHTGVTYINYGTFEGFDEFGNATGAFTGSEVAVSGGYAMPLGAESPFFAGAHLKFISSRLEQFSSLGLAADLGFTYYNEDSQWLVSIVGRNMGTQLTTYAGEQEPLPFELAAGVSKTLSKVPLRWSFTLENLQVWDIAFRNPTRDQEGLDGQIEQRDDPGFFNNVLRHSVLGAELFPDRGFTIRLGYNFRRGEELRIVDQRSFAGISAGFELKIKRARFSYAFARYNSAANSHFFGLNIDLN